MFEYGIDLAENLNFCSIIIGKPEKDEVRLAYLANFNKVSYPQIEGFVLDKLIPTFPPFRGGIHTDYTNEKSFSEFLETHLNPAWSNPNSSNYKKWTWVDPVIMNDVENLALYQNAYQMMEDGIFRKPDRNETDPEMWALWEKLDNQLMETIYEPSRGNTPIKFPKPKGQDNDMAKALILMLKGARHRIGHFSGTGGTPTMVGKRIEDSYPKSKKEIIEDQMKKKLKNFGITDIDIKY